MKVARIAVVPLLLLGLTLIGGCNYYPQVKTVKDADLVKSSYKAAESMVKNLQLPLDPNQNVIMATLVNIDSLESSSAFGRIVSEQISSRLAQLGYTVVELKLRDNIFIKQQAGEFILSRELRNISLGHNAQAVVTGTYAVGQDQVYLDVRMIRPTDNVVLSAYDYSLPIGKNTRALLRR